MKKDFEEMMDKIITRYGFEANETIVFCTLCEQVEKGKIKETKDFSIKKCFKSLIKG